MLEYHSETYYVFLMTLNFSLTLVVMLAACLCCKKKVPKNELLGLEGMVKLKNPDEVLVLAAAGSSESQADLNLSTISNADSEKRASTAAHRSLPDIPISENIVDNGSELYETVADKHLLHSRANQDKSPTPSLKQLASVSQHSSISQADDISSPYSRVKNSPHGYAKVRSTEHPYAQLNPPSATVALATSDSQIALSTTTSNHDSQHVIRASNQNLNESQIQAEIPAASAIAGIIAASQDLPYMTPPISTHFSGDSQDSSKGYTSISVREPLANILAQQSTKSEHCKPQLPRDVNDSHYATVSDDSDETYAAIEDPNGRPVTSVGVTTAAAVDIYTSGSETYAQIQPMPNNSIVVSVEINNASTISATTSSSSFLTTTTKLNSNTSNNSNSNKSTTELSPVPPPVDSLRVQMHSRQASSSSNNSSMGILGSPKPEKRQANSPLPPTPKSSTSQQQILSSSNSNLTSGRNSVISVIECSSLEGCGAPKISTSTDASDDSPQRKIKSLSPSKDIEGMYAKVMKKNKFSRNASSSQNNSPIMTRKYNDLNSVGAGVSALDSAAAVLIESQHVTDKTRTRSNSCTAKDHGYETIPADAGRMSGGIVENRKSDCYANFLQKERQMEGALKLSHPPRSGPELSFCNEKDYESIVSRHQITTTADAGYETLLKSKLDIQNQNKSSDSEPNYEVLNISKYNNQTTSTAALSDDGYAKVLEKPRIALDEDSIDGYSKIKGAELEDSSTGGYSIIGEARNTAVNSDRNHNYASIIEAKSNENESDHYAHIAETNVKRVAPTLLLDAISKPAVVDDAVDGRNLHLSELPATPSPLTSSSLIANSSTGSSTGTSTLSSHQTPSSQYESLTGSDTDPNYESVCYLNASPRENPYERLQTDLSDNQFSTPITPEESSRAVEIQLASVLGNDSKVLCASKMDASESVVVDDYFQV